VHRIWNAFGLQPHRSETFKLSSDPLFVEKVRDIVGLYLSPPERSAPIGENVMARITKRIVDAAGAREKDCVIWDDELTGFGLRVFTSGKRSYVIQYRAGGRSRRYTIGLDGVWAPETARQEAKVQFGRIAKGDNPAEERQLDHRAITRQGTLYPLFADFEAGLSLGKAAGRKSRQPSAPIRAASTATSSR
jgi:hypothetical protein